MYTLNIRLKFDKALHPLICCVIVQDDALNFNNLPSNQHGSCYQSNSREFTNVKVFTFINFYFSKKFCLLRRHSEHFETPKTVS
jgi:hypothetical protein